MTTYIYRHVTKDPDDPFESGDEVDGYEVLEPLPRRHANSGRHWEVHPHRTPLPVGLEQARVIRKLICRACERWQSIARIVAGSDGLPWILIRPERLPTPAQRRGHLVGGDLAMPLHQTTRGGPHPEFTSCRCGQRYLVLVFEQPREVTALLARLVGHSLRVS